MKYVLERALQKLWQNRRVYFFLALELTIGIAVTLCGYLSSRSAQNRINLYNSQYERGSIALEYYSDRNSAKAAITYDDYRDLYSIYGSQCDFTFFLYSNAIYQCSGNNQVEMATILSMNEDAFNAYFSEEQLGNIYVGKNIAKALNCGEVIFPEKWFQMDNDTVQIGDHTAGPIKPLKNEPETLVTRALMGFDLDVSQLIILPESMMDALESESDTLTSFLLLGGQTEGVGSRIADAIVTELSHRHTDYTYTFVNQGMELERSTADLTQEVRLLSWVSKVALAITTIGIVGVMFLFLQYRRREYAIALAQGATHQRLFLEMFCEILLLSSIGGIAATFVTLAIIPRLSTSMFTVVFHWTAIFVVLLIVFVVTICVCVLCVLGIRNIYPTKILQS